MNHPLAVIKNLHALAISKIVIFGIKLSPIGITQGAHIRAAWAGEREPLPIEWSFH